MKRIITTKVRIEHADCPLHCLFLECRLPSGRYLETAVSFRADAPRHSAAFQRYRLIQLLIECQGIDQNEAWATNLRLLTGRYFTFRLIELDPGVWAIDAAKAAEAFQIAEPGYEELERLLREASHVC